MLSAPTAHAAVPVTYEVVSADIGSANVEFFDGHAREARPKVPLPWRTTVMLDNPASLGTDVAEIRADWRWAAAPNRWVTVRVYFGNVVRCANTLDVGDAACYGTTGFENS
ncbi:hypothetical protein BRW65_01140 [Mycobacterium paraffinicum]|uniref:Uncharacterized protein n=1 Tax=Mycobacterium paraffinicum TaxID=53378 RepID=A0A1Q4I2Z2_9MYCO|nr:hypothetical protein BRW65_01140 [Mycobacterium paraffinicum]